MALTNCLRAHGSTDGGLNHYALSLARPRQLHRSQLLTLHSMQIPKAHRHAHLGLRPLLGPSYTEPVAPPMVHAPTLNCALVYAPTLNCALLASQRLSRIVQAPTLNCA